MNDQRSVVYFSMEIVLDPMIPTYSGGLEVCWREIRFLWQRISRFLFYRGDQHHQLCQEVILGIGGVRILRTLGYERIREKCIFTTHFPIPAGHDQFSMDWVNQILGYREVFLKMKEVFCCDGLLNMTYLPLNLSGYISGVAKKHSEVSRWMFTGYSIDAITNGVHIATWVSPTFEKLYDRYIPDRKKDHFNLRYALSIPKEEIWEPHLEAKKRLVDRVNREDWCRNGSGCVHDRICKTGYPL